MPRRLRYLTPGAVVHVTSNVVRGQHLFTPTEEFNERMLGVWRRAQKRHGMVVIALVVLSNHIHALLRPRNQTQLSDFMRDVNSGAAKLVQDLYGVSGTVFAARYAQSECLDDEAVLHDYRYILSNSVQEGLVEDPRHWPGIHSATELCGGKPQLGRYFDQEAYLEAKREDPTVEAAGFWRHEAVELTPIPQFRGLDRYQRATANRKLVQEIRSEHAARRTRPVLGQTALKAQSHRFIPEKVKTTGFARHKAKGAAAKALVEAAMEAYKAMVAAYRAALARFISGDHAVTFPPTCYVPQMARSCTSPAAP